MRRSKSGLGRSQRGNRQSTPSSYKSIISYCSVIKHKRSVSHHFEGSFLFLFSELQGEPFCIASGKSIVVAIWSSQALSSVKQNKSSSAKKGEKNTVCSVSQNTTPSPSSCSTSSSSNWPIWRHDHLGSPAQRRFSPGRTTRHGPRTKVILVGTTAAPALTPLVWGFLYQKTF